MPESSNTFNESSVGTVIGDNNQITQNFSTSLSSNQEILKQELREASPYLGLERFEIEDEDRFFGRDGWVQDLSKHLEASNLVMLLGASGSGKSSVIRAGLIPKLQKQWIGSKIYKLAFPPDEDPFGRFKVSLLAAGFNQSEVEDAFGGERVTLLQAIQKLHRDAQWLIFIDQFEELFIRSHKDKRNPFASNLVELVKAKLPNIKLVLAMRADFTDQLTPHPELERIIRGNIQILTNMSSEELKDAIRKPAEKHGVSFEENLVDKISDDFFKQSVSLPLLQYTLDELWKKSVKNGEIKSRALKTKTYLELGGVEGALKKRAEEIYQAFKPEEQKAAEEILIALVDVVNGKIVNRRADKNQFRNTNLRLQTLNKLINNRLLVTGSQALEDQEDTTVEVAHEAFLTSWSRLRDWITSREESIVLKNRLCDDAKVWYKLQGKNKHNANFELWSGSKLERVLELRNGEIFASLDPTVNEFIDASITYRDHLDRQEEELKKRQLQQARRIAAVAGVVSGMLAGLTIFAGIQLRESSISQVQTLAASSENHLTSGESLEALIDGIRAGKILNHSLLKFLPEPGLSDRIALQLQRILYSSPEINRLKQEDIVFSTSVSPQNKIAIGTQNGTIKLLGFDGSLHSKQYERGSSISSVDFNSDGTILASGNSNGLVKLWKVNEQNSLTTLEDYSVGEGVISVQFSPAQSKTSPSKYLAVATNNINGRGGSIQLLEILQNGRALNRRVKETSSSVNDFSFSPNGDLLVSAEDRVLRLYEITSDGFLEDKRVNFSELVDNELIEENGKIASVAFSPGKLIVSGDSSGHTKIWNENGKLIAECRDQNQDRSGAVTDIQFKQDGTFVTANSDTTLKLWRIQSDQCTLLTTFRGHQNIVKSVDFSLDGHTLVSGGQDKTVRLWQFSEHVYRHTSEVEAVSFSPDGELFASSDFEGKVKLWNVKEIENMENISSSPVPLSEKNLRTEVKAIQFSPRSGSNSQLLVSANSNGTITFWRISENKLKFERTCLVSPYKRFISTLSFSSDGKVLAVASGDDRDTTIYLASISSLLSVNQSCEEGHFTRIFSPHKTGISILKFSPDGQTLVSGSDDKIQLWHLDPVQLAIEPIALLDEHEAGITSLEFSPDGSFLASASADETGKLWRITENGGEMIHSLPRHEGGMTGISFSPDSRTLVSSDGEGTIRFWSVPNGNFLFEIQGGNSINNIHFNPNRNIPMLISSSNSTIIGTDNDIVTIWSLNLENVLNEGCNLIADYLKNGQELSQSDRSLCSR